jgi:predicted RNase H-like HicB family nuclease
MGRIKVVIKTSFGEVILQGETPKEVLDTLKEVPSNFIEEISTFVSAKLVPPSKMQLEGIVEFTNDGPVITTRQKLTHYEAIALIIYASENRTNTAAQIEKLLEMSGIKSMVPARLNEMVRRGVVFKPSSSKPDYKLSVQGERWIEEEVLPKLRSTTS